MLKDMEDCHIYFGTEDQAVARTINFSINEEHDGKKFSWMVGHEGYVDFFLAEPAKVDLLIHVRPFTPPGTPPQRLKVFLNETVAGDHVLPLIWSDQFYPLPYSELKQGWNRLTFHCRYIYNPADVRDTGEEGDHRMLGVAFSELHLQKKSFADRPIAERVVTLQTTADGIASIKQDPGTVFRTYIPQQQAEILYTSLHLEAPDMIYEGQSPLLCSVIASNASGQRVVEDVAIGTPEKKNIRIQLSSLKPGPVELAFYVRMSSINPEEKRHIIWDSLTLSVPESPIQEGLPVVMDENLKPLDKRDVVIFLVDTFRQDSLGCYGNPFGTSPVFDRFSRTCLQYRGYTQTSWTRPSVASIFTGLLPEGHGVLKSDSSLHESIPRFVSHFKREGYFTAAVSANPQISKYFGFARDFDVFLEVFNNVKPEELKPELLDRLINIDELSKSIDDLYQNRIPSDKPLFLYVHIMDPHSPYNAPHPFPKLVELPENCRNVNPLPPGRKKTISFPVTAEFSRQTLQKYYGEIRYTDDRMNHLFHLVSSRSVNQRPLIVVTGDHGEEFFEHGGMGHGRWLFEETMNVPLLVNLSQPVETINQLFPVRNILPGLIIPILTGQFSLAIPQDNHLPEPVLYADELAEKGETFWHSACDGQFKCSIRVREDSMFPGILDVLLYNLKDDPLEQNNISEYAEIQKNYLIERIYRMLRESRMSGFRDKNNRKTIDESIQQQLKMLGYAS